MIQRRLAFCYACQRNDHYYCCLYMVIDMNYTVAQIMHLVEERYITFLNNQTYDFHLADDKTDRITGGTLCGKVHFAYTFKKSIMEIILKQLISLSFCTF